jgi:beta-lactamase superfamily II metal-dependent hydrolase
VRWLLPILILAVVIIAPSIAYVPDTLIVTFLDVGQDDSILVQTPNGRAMLVDWCISRIDLTTGTTANRPPWTLLQLAQNLSEKHCSL